MVAVCALLFLLATWAFLPSLNNDFIGYDDALFVTANPQAQEGLSWKGVEWAFRNPVSANWHPLTTLSHMLDCQLYGLAPRGHHLTSVLLHAASVVLVFLVFRRMTGDFWRPVVLAALFGLHPLRVESVAWITERKDVLSTLFFLLTLWSYAGYVGKSEVRSPKSEVRGAGSRRAYALTLIFFALGLMSKPMLVTLPCVLLLLDYWPLRRFDFKSQDSPVRRLLTLMLEKLPFFALSAAASVMTFLVQRQAGAVSADLSLGGRIANALVSYARYMGKTFWPDNLAVFYPHPGEWPTAQVQAAAGLLLALFCVVSWLAGRRPYLVVGWLWFCGTLVPVIGLVQVGSQAMADRYSYIPSIGLFLMLVWGIADVTVRWRYRTTVRSVFVLAAVVLCLAFTRRQIGYWKDEETLWLHTLAVTENNELANLGVVYFNLGMTRAEQGRFEEAIPYYQKAIQLNPNKDDAHASLAYALWKQGKVAEAVAAYEVALRLNPDNPEARNNLGHILARQGQVEKAMPHLTEALRLKPDYPEAHDNLGAVLAAQGRFAEAAAEFAEVLRLNPDHPSARQKLERARAAQQRLDAAVVQFQEAIRRAPNDATPHYNLANALAELGRRDEAIAHLREALRIDPDYVEARQRLLALGVQAEQ